MGRSTQVCMPVYWGETWQENTEKKVGYWGSTEQRLFNKRGGTLVNITYNMKWILYYTNRCPSDPWTSYRLKHSLQQKKEHNNWQQLQTVIFKEFHCFIHWKDEMINFLLKSVFTFEFNLVKQSWRERMAPQNILTK